MDQYNHNALPYFSGVFIIIWLVFFLFGLYLNWRIAEKSGYPGAYSLLMLIPLVNIVVLLIWVFSEWPVEIQARRASGGTVIPR